MVQKKLTKFEYAMSLSRPCQLACHFAANCTCLDILGVQVLVREKRRPRHGINEGGLGHSHGWLEYNQEHQLDRARGKEARNLHRSDSCYEKRSIVFSRFCGRFFFCDDSLTCPRKCQNREANSIARKIAYRLECTLQVDYLYCSYRRCQQKEHSSFFGAAACSSACFLLCCSSSQSRCGSLASV